MKINIKQIIILTISICIMSILIGFSFAYFKVNSDNKNNQKISIENGSMELTYTDCIDTKDCSNISADLEPGDSITKTFSVKNTGTLDTEYKLIFSKSSNTFVDNELVYTLYNNDDNKEITNGVVPFGDKTNSYIYTESIKTGETKNYKITITFKDIESGNNESNKEGTFNINLGIDVNNVWNFDYTGDVQEFIVPKDGKYSIELWGAAGGSSSKLNIAYGGYVSGKIVLTRRQKIYIYVGENPTYISGSCYESNSNNSFNGTISGSCAGGGGATDIRLSSGKWNSFDSLKSRIIVASGGGGSYYIESKQAFIVSGIGGSGGGLRGYDGTGYNSAISHDTSIGGTQTKYYFGKGMSGTTSTGSGYYGGSYPGASNAGGGSSYISGHNGCVAITEDSTENNIKQRLDSNGNTCMDGTTDITCSYHYSGYIFTDTKMIDGLGYNWTTEKGEYVGQPQPDGSITKGHAGNGYARITYLGNN